MWAVPSGTVRLGVVVTAVASSLLANCGREDREHNTRSSPPPAVVVRSAAVAGTWYEGEQAALAASVDAMLAQAAPAPKRDAGGAVRALISPHAGYRYSGRVAAHSFAQVRGADYRRVVVLGPSHRGRFRGLSIANVTHYQTPLGEIALDQQAIAMLRISPLVVAADEAHREEHSIEMQLPLLQRALAPGWTLVPILVGGLDIGDFASAAETIRPLLDDSTLLVASGDFTHYGPNYGYLPFAVDGQIAQQLNQLDMGALDRIVHRDTFGLIDYREHTGITACAFGPVAILSRLLGEATEHTVLSYRTSGEIVGDYTNSVSYLSVAFSDPKPFSQGIPMSDLKSDAMVMLHSLASRAVEVAASRGSGAASPDVLADGMTLPASVRPNQGAFVTLKQKNGDLRGCIGHIAPVEPLYRAVVDNAVSAALRDPRFPPVRADEVSGLDVEVSVLSPLRPIPSWRDFELGKHGIVINKNGRRAVFLPHVAVEQRWTREETLAHLSQKAGLPADAWMNGASFEVFTTQAYHAPLSATSAPP